MRKSALVAFAFTVAAATNSFVHAQSQSDYPWRQSTAVRPAVSPNTLRARTAATTPNFDRNGMASTSAPTSNLRVAQNTMIGAAGLPPIVTPAPPTMKRTPFLVSFRNQAQPQDPVQDSGADSQPSVSDVQQYTFDPPQAPSATGTIESNPGAGSSQQYPGSSGYSFESPQPGLMVQSNAATEDVDYCGRDCQTGFCNLGCERQLFGQAPGGLEIGGWMNLGYHNRNNPLFNNRKSEANLHQAWMFFDKAASQNTGGWDFGYHADLVYGVDGQDLQAFGNPPTGAPAGWDNSWDYGSYGWALPQAYVQFANECWDVKVGKFFSPFGYESLAAKQNFFYSHSYTRYNSEPFTMSGVLAERRVSDNRSVIIGATAGWDTGFENNSGGNLITGMRYQPSEYVELALTSSLGDTGYRDSGTMNSLVAQMQLTNDLKYVFQADVLDLDDNQEFGVVQYMFKDINPCLALGARLEWWKSDRFFADTKSTYDFTMGANYRFNANLMVRPELRFDWGAGAIDPGTPIVGFDMVLTY